MHLRLKVLRRPSSGAVGMFTVLRCSHSSAVPLTARQIASLSHFPESGRDRLPVCQLLGSAVAASGEPVSSVAAAVDRGSVPFILEFAWLSHMVCRLVCLGGKSRPTRT